MAKARGRWVFLPVVGAPTASFVLVSTIHTGVNVGYAIDARETFV
jgi:hypothetical protein